MTEDVFIVAIVFGSIISIVFLTVIGTIIRSWIKKGSGNSLTENQEFLAALREFKEKTERRISNLEAIVTDEKPPLATEEKKSKNRRKERNMIEIELESESGEVKDEKAKSGKLKNMLNQ